MRDKFENNILMMFTLNDFSLGAGRGVGQVLNHYIIPAPSPSHFSPVYPIPIREPIFSVLHLLRRLI